MTKLVNLDQLNVSLNREVIWKGATYTVRDFSVRDFVTFQALFKEFQKAHGTDDTESLIDVTKKLVSFAVEGFPIDDVETLNPVQLLAFVALIANMIPDETPKEAPEGNAVAETGAPES